MRLRDVSVFFGQHDGDDALGDRRIGRVWRMSGMSGERLVEVIDLEKDHGAVGFERAKVMFFVGIVGVAKIVVHGDGLDPGCANSALRFTKNDQFSLRQTREIGL